METKLSEQNQPLYSSAILFGIGGIIFSAIRVDLLWLLTSLLYTVLLYGTSKIRDIDEIQHGVFKWTPIPLALGITGISPFIGSAWVLGDLAFAAFAPMLSFMILLNLAYHTRFKTNTSFTTFFIFMFTLAAGGISGIIKFLSDRHIGTVYLSSNHHLMIGLMVITLFGLIGTLIFILYLDRNLSKDRKKNGSEYLISEFLVSVKYFKSHFFNILNSYFWSKEDQSLLLTSKILQIGILALVFFNLAVENSWALSIALISFGLSIIPSLRYQKFKISPSFQFWISAALFFYVSGESLRFQGQFRWWNDFSHFLAGIVIGALIIIFLLYLNEVFYKLHIPTSIIPIFVLTFILSVGVIWETFEFLMDNLFGTSLQGGLRDTVFDMIGNTIGAFFALIITEMFTPFEVFNKVDQRYKKENWIIDLKAYITNIPIFVLVIVSGFIGLFFVVLRADLTLSIISSALVVLIFGISKFSKRFR